MKERSGEGGVWRNSLLFQGWLKDNGAKEQTHTERFELYYISICLRLCIFILFLSDILVKST